MRYLKIHIYDHTELWNTLLLSDKLWTNLSEHPIEYDFKISCPSFYFIFISGGLLLGSNLDGI